MSAALGGVMGQRNVKLTGRTGSSVLWRTGTWSSPWEWCSAWRDLRAGQAVRARGWSVASVVSGTRFRRDLARTSRGWSTLIASTPDGGPDAGTHALRLARRRNGCTRRPAREPSARTCAHARRPVGDLDPCEESLHRSAPTRRTRGQDVREPHVHRPVARPHTLRADAHRRRDRRWAPRAMTPRALRIATATDASRSSGFPSSRHRRATWVKSLGVV